jgi:hypothetical protein
MTARPTVLTAAADLAAGAVHGFRNTGDRPLEMTSIHPAAEMVTEWIEEG